MLIWFVLQVLVLHYIWNTFMHMIYVSAFWYIGNTYINSKLFVPKLYEWIHIVQYSFINTYIPNLIECSISKANAISFFIHTATGNIKKSRLIFGAQQCTYAMLRSWVYIFDDIRKIKLHYCMPQKQVLKYFEM